MEKRLWKLINVLLLGMIIWWQYLGLRLLYWLSDNLKQFINLVGVASIASSIPIAILTLGYVLYCLESGRKINRLAPLISISICLLIPGTVGFLGYLDIKGVSIEQFTLFCWTILTILWIIKERLIIIGWLKAIKKRADWEEKKVGYLVMLAFLLLVYPFVRDVFKAKIAQAG